MITIDIQTARRFVLGKQGLWPGRRWQGLPDVATAMREIEYLQLDPLQIIARSQDIQLHGRLLDYTPAMWETVTYQQRQFFDWGGWLAVRPMHELPYWRTIMHQERDTSNRRLQATQQAHAAAIAEMRQLLHQQETVKNRDFAMAQRQRTQDYRGRKDSAIALYYLWRTGEVMTHHREKFERVYALTEAVAPADFIFEHDPATAERFILKKEIAFAGLAKATRHPLTKTLVADGEIVEVTVEGWKAIHYVRAEDVPLLETVSHGRVPASWTPLQQTTTEEATFLAPLDPVSARGRAKTLFNFDYVWEVYKPLEKRQYGYYTLPVLWGDALVARFDSKLDRSSNSFVVLGLWLEEASLAKNELFIEALAAAFVRFTHFLGADRIDATAVSQPPIRKRLQALNVG